MNNAGGNADEQMLSGVKPHPGSVLSEAEKAAMEGMNHSVNLWEMLTLEARQGTWERKVKTALEKTGGYQEISITPVTNDKQVGWLIKVFYCDMYDEDLPEAKVELFVPKDRTIRPYIIHTPIYDYLKKNGFISFWNRILPKKDEKK